MNATEPSPHVETADDLLGATRLAFYTPIRDYPPLADRKAGAILAADGLLISVLLLFGRRMEILLHGPSLPMKVFVGSLIAAFAAFLLTGGYSAYAALTMPIPHMPESLAYFPEIARLELDEYRSRISNLTHRQVVHKMLIYNYSLATLCTRKFALVRRATACIRAEFVLWVAILLTVTLART